MAAATAAALARMSYSLARSPLRLPGSADINTYIYINVNINMYVYIYIHMFDKMS